MTEESAFDFQQGQKIFVLSTLSRLRFETIQPPVLYALGFPSSPLHNGRLKNLNTHLQLTRRLKNMALNLQPVCIYVTLTALR